MITSYASLIRSVSQKVPENLRATIPEAISYCEAAINRAIRNRQQEQRDTLTPVTEYAEFPTDYRDIRDIQLNTSTGTKTLEMMAPSQINALGTTTGEPRAFCVIANQIQFAPPPDGTYTAEIVYFKKVPSLSPSVTSNWFLLDHPDVYAAGTLTYVLAGSDLPAAEAYGNLFSKLMADVNREDKQQKWSGPPMMTRAA